MRYNLAKDFECYKEHGDTPQMWKVTTLVEIGPKSSDKNFLHYKSTFKKPKTSQIK